MSITERPDYVKGEIYKIVCNENGLIYIGQTQTHVLNRGKYREFGYRRRWEQHMSEALNDNKKQSIALNNCIRKYGRIAFTVELVETCEINNLDDREKFHIATFDSYNKGLNCTTGGKSYSISEGQRERIATTLFKGNDMKRVDRLKGRKIKNIRIVWKTKEYNVIVEADNDEIGNSFTVTHRTTRDEVVARIYNFIMAIASPETTIYYKNKALTIVQLRESQDSQIAGNPLEL